MSTIEKKSVQAGQYVSAEHVDALISNYKKERWIHNTERMGEEDTLGIYFSLEGLEEFIQTAKEAGADGINICFGVYGGKADRPEYEGKQTVALVATRSEEANEDTMITMNSDPGSSTSTTIPGGSSMPYFNFGVPKSYSDNKISGGKGLGLALVTDKNGNMRVV
jgi:hypothetical protein